MRIFLPALALVAAGLLASHPLRAAQSYANCTGFVDSLPAAISTPGVWCLRQDLSTDIVGGSAISINTNNVTVDCNHFKLGGLAAGPGTLASGIAAFGRNNVIVRNCNIRGFGRGIFLQGDTGSGHLVTDNLLDGNRLYGISIQGDGRSMVRRNRVRHTGGSTEVADTVGISSIGDVLDNTVDGVSSSFGDGSVQGILSGSRATAPVIRGNRVRGLAPHGSGEALGIVAFGPRTMVDDNRLSTATSGPNDRGIINNSNDAGINRDNTISGFTVAIIGQADDLGDNAAN